MIPIKRQFNFDQPFNVVTKKLRTFDEQNFSITYIEHLSNELFYEIFDYLDACDIYKSFTNLNIRFQNLLTHSFLPLKVNISDKSLSTVERHCRHVIIPNKHRMLSIHFNDCSVIDEFFLHCNIDSSFNRLESIVLNEISDYKLLFILFYLNSLPNLLSLTVQMEEDCYCNIGDIYRLVFRLPSLKFNKISFSDHTDLHVLMPISINEKFSTIEHLVIDLPCNLDELTSILHHTPYLRYLTCKRLIEIEETSEKEVSFTLPNLIHASFLDCHVKFDVFEVFIKKICSHLQVLRLKTSSDMDYLNGNRWKNLIKKYMSHLDRFHFDHRVYADEDFGMIPNHEAINQFTSTFWTERQWFFEFKDDFDQFVYSIHPMLIFNQKWFNSNEHKQIMNQCTSIPINISHAETGKAAILTIKGYACDTWDLLYIDQMKLCFSATQFTHLNIDCNGIPSSMLIEIIRLLPNLNSLEVSYLPSIQLNCLSGEDTEILLLVSITNRITKVKLNNMDDMVQVYFLMNLCSRMQYFEVECTKENGLENIIGSISFNNSTRIPYLCCLSLCISNVNEKTIQDLHTFIDYQRLFHAENAFHNYIVQRIRNKIFLTWKL